MAEQKQPIPNPLPDNMTWGDASRDIEARAQRYERQKLEGSGDTMDPATRDLFRDKSKPLILTDPNEELRKRKEKWGFKKGGKVKKTGSAKVHKGEFVVKKSAAAKPGMSDFLSKLNSSSTRYRST